MIFVVTALANEGNTRESLFEAEVPLRISLGQMVELFFVAFHMLNKVDEVARFLEFLEVLSVNHVAELILNADDQLNNIEGVESVSGEGGVKSNGRFLGRAEVVLGD